ncbi:sensor histidine kinase [Halorussus pelagicus]|uniref:sensor histidine kinase n=1 Tax=Halorussus pelagicus TaxID=2505977 RepID=UPI00140CBB27|nr:HAMP domain-containing sensor histidine kinase [Halorussus pelagicus]
MRPESPTPVPADRLGTESSPVRILPILSHTGNQRVLANWVQTQEQYEIVSGDHAELSAAEFDIAILDEHSLREYDTEIRGRKADAETVLPVLLVSSDTPANTLDTPDRTEIEPSLRQIVDEILATPIDIAELRSRLDSLARIRAQSIALERKTNQLLLLNRITRHDIRNEMNVVIGWTEQLADHTDDAGDQIRQRVLDSGQHVVGLTKAVREFIETLKTAGEPDLQAVDLTDVVTDELTKRRETFEAADFVIDGEIPPVDVRANDLLASVFRNVLNNAVQHNNSETPRVEIGVVDGPERVAITIADDGPGIPPDQRDAVLGRTDRGLDHPAAGLGLYLVDTLVTKYGGTLRIGDAELGGVAVEIELLKEPTTGTTKTDHDS